MKRLPLILLLAITGASRALAGPSPRVDSLLPVRLTLIPALRDKAVDAELTAIEQGNQHEAFVSLITMVHKTTIRSTPTRRRLFLDLAKVSSRLRLYPLTMKCFYNITAQTDDLPQDSTLYRDQSVAESVPVNLDSIRSAFADGKQAIAYALLLHIKQPVAGKRKAFVHLSNVGHTFITLIKYNRDNTVVCRSFGFYPQKSTLLSATPLHPSSPSVFKNDSRHQWDETAGKFISARQFDTIIGSLQAYDHKTYNLNHANCTDFGLEMARIAGIRLNRTIGHWPLGKGNNPGSAGQSMLEGNLTNSDPLGPDALFVSFNNIPERF